MIRIHAPGLTTLQAGTILRNKTVPIVYHVATYYDPASPLTTTPGLTLDTHVVDEDWGIARSIASEIASTLLVTRVSIEFSAPDISQRAGRLADKLFFVKADGGIER